MWDIFKKKNKEKEETSYSTEHPGSATMGMEFGGGYQQAMEVFHNRLEGCSDLVERQFTLKSGEKATLFYIDGMINQDLLQRDLLPIITVSTAKTLSDPFTAIPISNIKKEQKVNNAIQSLFSGFAVFAVEGWSHAFTFELKGWEKRAIEESPIERNIKGPHEGFVESLRVNTSILRRKIRTSQLKFKELTLGERSHTNIVIAYIEGIANPDLLHKLEQRLKDIDIDAIQAAGYIEQLTVEHPHSPFPQYEATERPDKVASCLLEGKLAIIIDGTPFALIAPVVFFQFFQTLDDYSTYWTTASFTRFFRIFSVFLTIFLPGFYIAVLTFHYEAIPWTMLVELAKSRSKVPFPPILEALLMEFTFELLREAAIRLPSYIGQAIGIVGGIIIGQAAVQAGIVSNIMVMVVGVTAVASFVVPIYDMSLAIRFIRFPMMFLSAVFGVVGLLVGGAFLLAHLLSLETLGQPYFAPLAPLKFNNLKDTFFRLPLTMMGKRAQVGIPLDKDRGRGRKRG